MTVKRPALRYFGGKWRVAPRIIKWFPPHKVYVEPFGGAASVLLRKDKSTVEVYNDIESNVVNFFQVMRDRAGDLLFKLYCTPFSREEYYICLNTDTDDPIEKARAFFAISRQSYMPSGVKPTGWKLDRSRPAPTMSVDDILSIIDRLRYVYIENRDFRVIIDCYDSEQTLFYIDPPYVDEGQDYICSLSKQDHIDLANLLARIDGYAIVSATDSKLYRQLYKGWIWKPLLTVKTLSGKVTKPEYLIMNYEWVEDDGPIQA